MYVFTTKGQIVMMMGRRGPFECCLCCNTVWDDDYDERLGTLSTEPTTTAHLTPSETLSIQNALVSHAGSGAVFGTLKNFSSALTPQYAILNNAGRLLMTIQGPRFGTVICWLNKTFYLYNAAREDDSSEGTKRFSIIGEISRDGQNPPETDPNIGAAVVTADFPQHLPPYAKAMVVAAMVEMVNFHILPLKFISYLNHRVNYAPAGNKICGSFMSIMLMTNFLNNYHRM